jgi:hypothetical protein
MRRPVTVKIGEQAYKVVGDSLHVTPSGRSTPVKVLRSNCPECSREFECTATDWQIGQRHLRRRCDDCKAPGKPIGRRRPPRRKSPREPQYASVLRAVVEAAAKKAIDHGEREAGLAAIKRLAKEIDVPLPDSLEETVKKSTATI